jgi:AmmeMemoRadiSam system protein B
MYISFLLILLLQGSTERPFRANQGYASDKHQIYSVVELSRNANPPASDKNPLGPMWVGVCPHDDHALTGPVYFPVMEKVKARHLILFGVAHKAWKWNVKDVLIFDDFQTWQGPLGSLKVDTDLREKLKKALPPDAFIVSNPYHAEEHSLEAFLPFLQFYDSQARILPILVPNMSWERMHTLAQRLAEAAARIAKEEGWTWGEDFQVLISNDSTHYGDQGWDGKNYAPFGAGIQGLVLAKDQDRGLIGSFLTGPIDSNKMKGLLYTLVDEKDLQRYKITWCGRFVVPFGLDFSLLLAGKLGQRVPEGRLLSYGTSVELGQLDVKDLDPTAPSNLRHWVAYTAMGWFAPDK